MRGQLRSPWCNVTSGVPRGTSLGPVMFLFYINDLPETVTSTSKLFADDCKIYREIRDRSDSAQLQDDLDSLAAWSRLATLLQQRSVYKVPITLSIFYRGSIPEG